jgi:hypothetical protein
MTSLGNFGHNQAIGNININSNLGLGGGNLAVLGNGLNFNNAFGSGLGIENGGNFRNNALNIGYNPNLASSNIISVPSHDNDNLQSD